jgi:hypothetical protein
MKERRSNASPILVGLIVLLVLPALYFGAYLLRGKQICLTGINGYEIRVRMFPTSVEAKTFTPAAHVESIITDSDLTALSSVEFLFERRN